MTGISWSSLTSRKFSKPLLLLLVIFGTYLLLLVWNLARLRKSVAGGYLPSVITLKQVSLDARLNQPVEFVWAISAPTPRRTERTALFWGETSTTSAYLSTPESAPYPNKSSDYWHAFPLPQEFEFTLVPTGTQTLYLRAYALVDNRHLWSEEISLKISE